MPIALPNLPTLPSFIRPALAGLAALGLLGGCSGPNIGPMVLRDASAYQAMQPAAESAGESDYVIGPRDTVNVTVFDEPDVSATGLLVDPSGQISMPLLGPVPAAGMSATQLARALEARLGARYYRHPRVSVAVTSSNKLQVTVQGAVAAPGIYPIQPPASLLDVVALAKGETEDAQIGQVVVLRQINGQRMAAMFNLARIRRGEDPDPVLQGRDVVIMGYSNRRQIWHDVLKASPLFNVFTRF